MSWLPLPYIQLESARTNGTDYLDTQWSAGYGFSAQFVGCAANGAYLFGAMTSEDSADKFALQFQEGKYIYYFGDQTAESPAEYELGEPHFFVLGGNSWSIDGVPMPSTSFSLSPSNEMTLNVYVGAVNVGGEAQHLSDVQIGLINFSGSSGFKQWRQCKTQDGQFGFGLYISSSITEFVEKPNFTYSDVMAAQSSTALTVIGAPTKKDYKLGEPFDPTGMTVYLPLDDGTRRNITSEAEAKYPDGSTEFRNDAIIQHGSINYIYYRYKPFGVDYTFFEFSPKNYYASIGNFPYTVSSDSPVESIEVTKLPDKTEYLIKEYFSTTGMVVTGHLEDGETVEIGDGYTSSPSRFTKEGTIDVTIGWYDGMKSIISEPFQVTVKNAVDKLNITLPTKSEYSIGEKFNPTGITVTALYLDGTERPIYNFFVDSSKFDSTKEGGYAITVKATVDEKEYTETITVYVFGAPKKLEDLLGTTEGMTVIRNNSKNDGGKDTISGVDWFVFDGNTASKIYVSGDNYISFNNTTEHIKICRRDGATYYVYSQAGKLDDGRKFFKIRVEGYTNWNSATTQYALKYELFLFDDNSMFLNILQAPTNTSYLGTSELYYYLTTPSAAGMTHVPFTVEAGKAQEFRFFTSDPAQGKPWEVVAGKPKKLEDLLNTTEGMEVIKNNEEIVSTVYVDGVPWFVSNRIKCEEIGVTGSVYLSNINLRVCRNTYSGGVVCYIYRQEGLLDNGHRFLKLRIEGYTRSDLKTDDYAVKYELFLFDDNGMYLNTIQVPTNGVYIGESGLFWSDKRLPFSFELGKPRNVSFYTTDPANGAPWFLTYYDYDFTKSSVRYLTAIPTKYEYNAGEEFDSNSFDVTATWIDGKTERITDFSVDSANFNKEKEGRYTVTVTAQIDGKEYTAETIVAVYGNPHSIYDLINTTSGMESHRVYNSGMTNAHIYGVPWFNFDGNNIFDIEASDGNILFFRENTNGDYVVYEEGENFLVCGRMTYPTRNYRTQEGKLENGHRFFKIRADVDNDQRQALYELFFFDDNSIYLNLINTTTLEDNNTSFLKWSGGTIEIPTKFKTPLVASFYTTDSEQGAPWTMEVAQHKFIKTVESISAIATKREYDLYDSLDKKAFAVTANLSDGTTASVSSFSVDSSSFDNTKEGRYFITVKSTVLGTEYTTQAVVVVYGNPYNILDLLNTNEGMERIYAPSYVSELGDVSWFVFDGKRVEEIGTASLSRVYFNGTIAVRVCESSYGTTNYTYMQEGKLDNGHKFLKLRCEGGTSEYFPTFELFLFDDNSMYVNILKTTDQGGKSGLTWSDGELEIQVTFGETQKASFYTDNPSEGKPWTMEVDYHNFIKEKMRTLTVNGGEGSGLYLPGESVTIKAEERTGNRFRWLKDGGLFVPKPKVVSMNSSYTPIPKNGNLLVFAWWSYSNAESSTQISGWTYDGTLRESGDKDAGSTENIAYVHIYHKINDGIVSTGKAGYYFEIGNAKSFELQESTRQENLLLTSANSFLCAKETDDLYLWFLFALYWSTSRRWVAQPDVISYFPGIGNSDSNFSVLIDENVPPVSFRVSVSSAMATRYGSAIGARIVPSYTGYEREMTFTMPDEDLTVTAEYSLIADRIEITKNPFKMNYKLDETFNPSGMVVTAHFADGTSKAVRDYTFSELDSSTPGAKEVTITYTDGVESVSATLTVNVGLKGIAITRFPNKTTYARLEDLDTEGLEVSIVYADDSTYPTEDYTLSFFDSTSIGIKTVTVTSLIDGYPYNAQFTVAVTSSGDNPFKGYNENRTMRIHFVDGKYKDITGDEIEGESMSLTESVGNDKNLQFGGCISTQFSVNIFSEQFMNPEEYPDGDIEVYLETPDDSLRIFTGTIESAERTGGINKRKLIAYDYLKRKSSISLKYWYESLTFPITQKDFRDSLFKFMGILQETTHLYYDDAMVPDNMNVDSITFLSLAKDICLCNKCFGHINADGVFEYITLRENGGIDQAGKLYFLTPQDAVADDEVISATFKEGKIWAPTNFWISPNPSIPYVDVPPLDNKYGYNVNYYHIRNSYMIGDKDWINKAYESVIHDTGTETYSADELKYPIVLGPTFGGGGGNIYAQEYSLTTPGNFLRKIGTNIEFNCIKYREDGTPVTWKINSFVMSRTITGVRSLKDVYTAKNSSYDEETYGVAKATRDNSDALNTVKDEMPKSTEESDGLDVSIEPFGGADYKGDIEWRKHYEEVYQEEMERLKREEKEEYDKLTEYQKKKIADMAAAKKAKEKKNTLTVYKDGTARYNGVTISGSGSSGGGGGGGTGGFDVQSVTSLPSNPDPNTIYLIQGEVVVN